MHKNNLQFGNFRVETDYFLRSQSYAILPTPQTMAGLKKVSSHCPRQIDFPSGQVTFGSHLHGRQGIKQVI